MKNKWIVPAIIIAVGLFLLGQRIEQGIVRSKEAVRTVSVKGLSEREVPADKVIWPLVYKELGMIWARFTVRSIPRIQS